MKARDHPVGLINSLQFWEAYETFMMDVMAFCFCVIVYFSLSAWLTCSIMLAYILFVKKSSVVLFLGLFSLFVSDPPQIECPLLQLIIHSYINPTSYFRSCFYLCFLCHVWPRAYRREALTVVGLSALFMIYLLLTKDSWWFDVSHTNIYT